MDNSYPMLDKIGKVHEKSQEIGEFLEWLRGQGYVLGKFIDHIHAEEECFEWEASGYKRWLCHLSEGENFIPLHPSIDDLLSQYFEIDQVQAEKERRALLERLSQ